MHTHSALPKRIATALVGTTLSLTLAAGLVPVAATQAFASSLDNAIAASANNVKRADTIKTTRLTVVRNMNDMAADESNVAAPGAYAFINGDRAVQYTADISGNLELPIKPGDTITVGLRVGYQTFNERTLTYDQATTTSVIRLQRADANRPVANAVYINNMDMLYTSSILSDDDMKAETTFTADIDWGNGGAGTAQLVCSNVAVDMDVNGNTATWTGKPNTLELADALYLVATSANGTTTKRQVKVSSSKQGALNKLFNGGSLTFGDCMFLKLPNTIPVIGGMTLNSPDFASFLALNASAANGEWEASISVKLFDASASGGTGKETKKETSNVVDMIKGDNYGFWDVSDIVKKKEKFKQLLENIKSNGYGDTVSPGQGSWGVSATIYGLGYLEGTYDQYGETSLAGGGLGIEPYIFLSGSFYIYPPIYFESSLIADPVLKLGVAVDDDGGVYCKGSADIDITLSAGLGIGYMGFVGVSGGVTGTVSPSFSSDAPSSVSLSAGGYAQVKLLFFQMKKVWNFAKATFPKQNAQAVALLSVNGETMAVPIDDNLLTSLELDDLDQFQVEDFSYLDEGSADYGGVETDNNSAVLLTSAGSDVTGDAVQRTGTTLRENIYRDSQVRYVDLGDGNRLALWNDIPSDRAKNADGVQLMYKHYDAKNGWEQGVHVVNASGQGSDTYDGTFDVQTATDAKGQRHTYVIWQNASTQVAGQSNVTEVAKNIDLAVSEFDESSMEFSDPVIIADPGFAASPTIVTNGTSTYAVWQSNSDISGTDLGAKGGNSVKYAKVGENKDGDLVVDTPVTLAADQPYIANLSANMTANGRLQVAYVTDTADPDSIGQDGGTTHLVFTDNALANTIAWDHHDGVAATSEAADGEVGTYTPGNSATEVPKSTASQAIAAPKYFNDTLYYTLGGVVQFGSAATPANTGYAVNGDYKVMQLDNQLCVVTLDGEDLATTLHACYLKTDETHETFEWVEGVDLTPNDNITSEQAQEAGLSADDAQYNNAIRSFDAFQGSDGTIHALVNNAQLTDTLESLEGKSGDDPAVASFDPYGTSRLQTVNISASVSGKSNANEVAFDAEQYVDGNNLTLSVPVKNLGTRTATATDWKSGQLSENGLYVTAYGLNNDGTVNEDEPAVVESIDKDLAPGEEDTVYISWPVSDAGAQQVHIRITNLPNTGNAEQDAKDAKVYDEFTIPLINNDVEVRDMTAVRDENNNVVLSASVANNGYTDADGVQVKVARAARTGEAVDTQSMSDQAQSTAGSLLGASSGTAQAVAYSADGASAADGTSLVTLTSKDIDGTIAAGESANVSYVVPADQVQDSDVFYVYLTSYEDSSSDADTGGQRPVVFAADSGTTQVASAKGNDFDYRPAPAKVAKAEDTPVSPGGGSGGDPEPKPKQDPATPESPDNGNNLIGGGVATGDQMAYVALALALLAVAAAAVALIARKRRGPKA